MYSVLSKHNDDRVQALAHSMAFDELDHVLSTTFYLSLSDKSGVVLRGTVLNFGGPDENERFGRIYKPTGDQDNTDTTDDVPDEYVLSKKLCSWR